MITHVRPLTRGELVWTALRLGIWTIGIITQIWTLTVTPERWWMYAAFAVTAPAFAADLHTLVINHYDARKEPQ